MPLNDWWQQLFQPAYGPSAPNLPMAQGPMPPGQQFGGQLPPGPSTAQGGPGAQMNPTAPMAPPPQAQSSPFMGGMMGPMAAAVNMLQASGPSRMPVGLGQIFGQGLSGFMGGSMADRQMQMDQQSQQNMAKIAQLLMQGQGGQGPQQGRPPTMMGQSPVTGTPAPPTTPIPGNPPVDMTGAGPSPQAAFFGYAPGMGMPSSMGGIRPQGMMGAGGPPGGPPGQPGQQQQMSPMMAMLMRRRGMGMYS